MRMLEVQEEELKLMKLAVNELHQVSKEAKEYYKYKTVKIRYELQKLLSENTGITMATFDYV